MPEIGISVQNKIASVISGTPRIICGNSDYTLTFNFDEEFSAYAEKTLCIVYRRRGKMVNDEVLFTGDTVALPMLYETDMCAIGVYAGNLISSTVVMIPCDYCAETEHHDPPPDIYEQLLEYLAGMQGGGALVGNAVPVLHGTMLTRVGSLEYPILQGTVEPLVNGGWYWGVNTGTENVLSFNLQTPPSNRVGLTRLYELPAGKSSLISATSEGKQIFVRYSANGITGNSSTDSGWQNLPYTITNSGAGSLYIGMQFRDPTDANITPEDIGTVTAVME